MIIFHRYICMNIKILTNTLFILFTLVLVLKAEDPGQADLIDGVPGYSDGIPRVFSNFLSSKSSGSQLHYILVQAQGGKDANVPLTIWIGGGLGCSSKIAFLQQIGPYYLQAGAPYVSTSALTRNIYAWSNLSHLLFIDTPPGVGFSTKTDDYVYNDLNTAQDNLNAVIYFLKQKFPSYQSKVMFLAGESYGGKMVPDLALRLNAYDGDFKVKLKGIIVGNGIMDFSDGALQTAQINYMFSRNMIDPTLQKYWEESCQSDPESAGCSFFFRRYDAILQKVNFQHIYGKCYQSSSLPAYINKQNSKIEYMQLYRKCQFYEGMQDYFTLNMGKFNGKSDNFKICSQEIYQKYERTEAGSMNEYSRLLSQTQIQVTLYSGDWDDLVPYTSTVANLQKIGFKQSGTVGTWLSSRDQHIGFKRTYAQGNRQLKFWVIKGAGHEAPQHKRQAAYDLFKNALGV